jgi:hypothetical protein
VIFEASALALKLKKLLAEQMLASAKLKDVSSRKW